MSIKADKPHHRRRQRAALALLAGLLIACWTVVCFARPRSPSQELQDLLEREYSYRDVHRADWPALFAKFAARLDAAASPPQFATVAAELLAAAGDVHITVNDGNRTLATFQRVANDNYSLTLIPALVPDVRSDHRCVSWGHTAEGVGYILIGEWTNACAASAERALDELRDAAGLIVDVRPNSGGNDDAAGQVAARFLTKPVIYELVARRVHGITTAREPRVLGPSVKNRFRGHVAVLMGPRCMSSNEAFLLMMRAAGAVLVGERSFGSSGNPQPHRLSNGVVVNLPSWIAYQPNGSLFEKHGVEPDVKVDWPTTPKDDVVLAAALRALRGVAK